jgi:hypothetical protein
VLLRFVKAGQCVPAAPAAVGGFRLPRRGRLTTQQKQSHAKKKRAPINERKVLYTTLGTIHKKILQQVVPDAKTNQNNPFNLRRKKRITI